MHILIVPSEHYVTQRSPLAAIFQYQQAHALRDNGIRVGIVSAGFVPFNMMLSRYPYSAFENDGGVCTYRCYKKVLIPGRVAIKVFWKYLAGLYLKLFETYVRDQGLPDIIHAHNCLFAGVVALKIKSMYAIPYLITEHSSAYIRGHISNQQANFTKDVLRNADGITVVSSSLGKSLENLYGAVAGPSEAIFNILDDRFEKGINFKDLRISDDSKFTFLSVGSLEDNKNHADLLKAFALKFKGNSRVQLRIGGHGPLRNQLQAQINALGITGQVLLTGMLSRDEVLCEMQNCNVFVLPSIYETFGVVLIEALAMGNPVVATKCGGPEDIVNINNGILVPAKDMNSLAEAMFSIYLNIDKYDPCFLRSDCLSKFGKDSFVKRLRNIYTNIQGKE